MIYPSYRASSVPQSGANRSSQTQLTASDLNTINQLVAGLKNHPNAGYIDMVGPSGRYVFSASCGDGTYRLTHIPNSQKPTYDVIQGSDYSYSIDPKTGVLRKSSSEPANIQQDVAPFIAGIKSGQFRLCNARGP